jgi:hypothetical protein
MEHLFSSCLALTALVVKYTKSQNSGNKFVVIFTKTVAVVGYSAALLLSVPILASIGRVYFNVGAIKGARLERFSGLDINMVPSFVHLGDCKCEEFPNSLGEPIKPHISNHFPQRTLSKSGHVRVNTHEIHYEVHGTGEKKLVLLMGFMASMLGWREVLAHFAVDHSVLVIDNRGIGLSTPVGLDVHKVCIYC